LYTKGHQTGDNRGPPLIQASEKIFTTFNVVMWSDNKLWGTWGFDLLFS